MMEEHFYRNTPLFSEAQDKDIYSTNVNKHLLLNRPIPFLEKKKLKNIFENLDIFI